MDSRQPTQLPLQFPGLEEPASNNGKSAFADPAFSGNKVQPVHRWVPWIAGFAAEFVRNGLAKYVEPGMCVLDPFAGVGTTLVEALLFGCEAIGFEINPYAALASRVKTQAHQIPIDAFQREITRFEEFFAQKLRSDDDPHSSAPPGFKTRGEFYSPKVLRKVLIVLDFIKTIDDPALWDLFRVAFAATMVSYSNYSYEPSLGRRASAGKPDIEDFRVDQAMLSKLYQMLADIEWFAAAIPQDSAPQSRVVNGSFFNFAEHIEPATVDLIITSPPYLNNYHYNRNTRPHLYWLGFAEQPADLKALEQGNFGKYWQTVRAQERIDLTFSLDSTDLALRLAQIRAVHPEKGVYGGRGWANYAAVYFNDSLRFAQAANTVLRSGGTALVVIGNSILQGVFIPTDEYFGQIAELAGLELVGIDIPRDARVGNSIIQSDVRVAKAKRKHRLYEAVVELRKP